MGTPTSAAIQWTRHATRFGQQLVATRTWANHKVQRPFHSTSKIHLPDAIPSFDVSPFAFDATSLNVYTTSTAPSSAQLKYANHFYTAQPPALMYSQAEFRLLPQSHHPEVVFLGRSNVGKSSMLNALFNRQGIAHTSSKPGKTKLMNAFGVSPLRLSAAPQSGTKGELLNSAWKRLHGGLFVVDMPGYGTGSRAAWGKQIMKYIEQRRQLRRAFLLVDSEHGLKSTDLALLTHMFRHGIPHTVVLSKVDKLIHPKSHMPERGALQKQIEKLSGRIADMRLQIKRDVWAGRDPATDFLCVSSERSLDESEKGRVKIGINELRWAALCACSLQQDAASPQLGLSDIKILESA